MTVPKQSRRRIAAKKLEPIDWHEFANDAVLNGNMSTLYHRPPTEDPSAYASPEALVEIKKRVGRPAQNAVVIELDAAPSVFDQPTVGPVPTVGADNAAFNDEADGKELNFLVPTVGVPQTLGPQRVIVPPLDTIGDNPTVGSMPTVGILPVTEGHLFAFTPATSHVVPTVGTNSPVGSMPTVGIAKRKVKPIRDVQDALTLAGQVLYKVMFGAPDGAKSKSCTKGYRQLAAETHLDKDTVRDLISEFKDKGIVREIGTYNPDTRSAKTYEILSYKAILQIWREAGLMFVTAGRQRPMFCTAVGELLTFKPTVGPEPTASKGNLSSIERPTVGINTSCFTGPSDGSEVVAQGETLSPAEVIQALHQITGNPVDQEAADRLIRNCRRAAFDCTIEEIVEFAWSKAFLCRSGKIENPIGFLITQVPKHFQREALQAYREKKRKELETAAALAAREEDRGRESERELAEMEERQRVRSQVAERHRVEHGIDLKSLCQDSEADEVLREWAKRMLNLGHRYRARYD